MRRALLILALAAFALPAGADQLVDRIAAVVDGKVVTLSEVYARAEPALARIPDTGIDKAAARKEILARALQDLVDESLLESELSRRQIEVTETDIDYAVSEVRRQNRLSEEDFRAAIEGQGYTWEGYRAEVRAQLERYKLLNQEVRAKVEVSDEEVQSWLARQGQAVRAVEEVHVRHVLVAVPKGADPAAVEAAREKAEAARARVAGGASFEAVAKEVSDDPTAAEGGDLGWIERGLLVSALEKAAFETAEGQLAGPVRSPFGWHVVQVVGRRERAVERDPAAEAQARQALMEQALERETLRFVEGLRRQAIIEIKIPELAS